ncbi:MAG: hypothetical protein EZS28_030008 [Streblomastix strix]|uniref:Protein kinase domain-containing protein n=1 Tax=Streblomastix strix TaxID=222440 RepID=A0A5J4UXK4_9EUKA|nr:MAG: hypothetical protein EZS28_030008 [Streblomastix strix]
MNNEEQKPEIQQQQDLEGKAKQNSQKQSVIDEQDDSSSVGSQQSSFVDYEEILHQSEFVPIRPLGFGAFGIVYEVYDRKYGIVAVKIIKKEKFDIRELEAAEIIQKDIKCDNILLHCPPGTGRVYAKISDFGFAKKEDQIHEQTYFAGTLPFMSPEQFLEKALITQKVDIYALGITFYNIITHKFPVNERNIKEQQKKMAKLKCIERPSEIKDDQLWDLLSKMLEFDPNKRITAAEALQHPYFTSPEAIADISLEQQKIAEEFQHQYFSSPEEIADISPEQQKIAEESTDQNNSRQWHTTIFD